MGRATLIQNHVNPNQSKKVTPGRNKAKSSSHFLQQQLSDKSDLQQGCLEIQCGGFEDELKSLFGRFVDFTSRNGLALASTLLSRARAWHSTELGSR